MVKLSEMYSEKRLAKLADRSKWDFLWWVQQKVRDERGRPCDFHTRRYLIAIYDSFAQRMVIKKAAQMGITTFAILKALWLCETQTVKIIYTMPTATDVTDFSQSRVDPIIRKSRLTKPLLIDNVGIKQLGDSFIYFRGAWNEKQAISIPSDMNIHDELDRSKPDIREMYEERLAASELGWTLDISTPTLPNYGIAALYEETDKREWFVKCKQCGYEEVLTEENIIDDEFRCLKCRAVLDRSNGCWRPTAQSDIVGFHITQLMAPWISAKEILRKRNEYRFKADYYNFVLGEEYAGGEGLLTRADILACVVKPYAVDGGAVIGVDWGDTSWAVVRKGGNIIHMQKIEGDTRTHAWQVAELMDKFHADAVCDFGYGDTKNKELIDLFPNRVWMCVYSDGVIYPKFDDKKRIVNIDRTRSIQECLQEIKDRNVAIFSTELLEEFIRHHLNLVETKEEDKHGSIRTVIQHVGDDHLVHANNYARLLEERYVRHTPAVTVLELDGDGEEFEDAII